MSDHRELADQRDEEADGLERESERVGEGVEAAKQAVDTADAESMIPSAMGEDDPGYRDEDGNKPSLDQGPIEP